MTKNPAIETATEKASAPAKNVFEIPGATPNFKTELAAQLAELVPEAVADGKLDIAKLKELLGDDADDESERFGITIRSMWIPSMNIKPIRNDDDLQAAFARLETVFQAAEGSPEADEMEVLVALIESYENKHYPVGPADPVEAIKFRMEQQGLAPKDLEPFIGSSGRVSEVLNRKRTLSLRMVKRLHDGLKIPYESLLSHAARLATSPKQ